MKQFVFSSKEDAEKVLTRLNEILPRYGNVSVSEFNDLVGLPSTHQDTKLVWETFDEAVIRIEGTKYILELPEPKAVK